MGCWNHTCFLSNLSVSYGDEIATLPLIRNSKGYGNLDTTRFYFPAPVMYYGTYDDYGGSEDCYGGQIDLILKEFRNHSNFQGTIEHFSREGDQGALHLGEEDDVDLVVIKKSVLDRFLEQYYYESWHHKTTDGEYHRVGYKYLCALIPSYITILKSHMRKFDTEHELAHLFDPLPVADFDHKHELAKIMHFFKEGHYTHPSNYFRQSIISRLQEMAKNDDDEGLTDLLQEICIFALMMSYMNYSRRVYIRPMCSSQETDPRAQEMMARITLDVADEDNRELRDEDDRWDPVREVFIEQESFRFVKSA